MTHTTGGVKNVFELVHFLRVATDLDVLDNGDIECESLDSNIYQQVQPGLFRRAKKICPWEMITVEGNSIKGECLAGQDCRTCTL